MSYISDPAYGLPDANNTTTATLGAAATYTGTATLNYQPDVLVSCFSDVAGTLYLDFSADGSTWQTFPTAGFSVSANRHEFHVAVKGPRYFRARYINGSAAQATFQLYTYYGVFSQPNQPLNQAYALDSDSILVRPSWTWLDVARGLAGGVTTIEKIGRNSAVPTSFAPISINGIWQTPQVSGATTLRIKAGGDANDTAVGTGARAVTIVGLDASFQQVTEVLTTAGASASAVSTNSYTRLLRAYVSSSGSYSTASVGSHAGTITIENGAGGTDWAVIDATGFPKGQTEIGAYCVPSGYQAFVKLRHVTIDSGKTVDLLFFSRTGSNQTAAPYDSMQVQSYLTGISGGNINRYDSPDVPLGPFTGPCDLGYLAKAAAGTASVAVEFSIFLVEV